MTSSLPNAFNERFNEKKTSDEILILWKLINKSQEPNPINNDVNAFILAKAIEHVNESRFPLKSTNLFSMASHIP